PHPLPTLFPYTTLFRSGRLIVYNNAVDTARNILAHERLFRLGTASNLTVFAIDIVLITALYVVLKPVSRNLALLAAFWGLVETRSEEHTSELQSRFDLV